MNVREFSLLGIFIFFSVSSVLAQEESLVYEPKTGNYIMHYYKSYGEPRVLQRVIITLANQIDPTIQSKFKATEKTILYRYKVKSGRDSRQPIIGMRFIASSVQENTQITPKGWRGDAIQNIVVFGDQGVRLHWLFDRRREVGTAGLLPGQNQFGFGVESIDLPGMGLVRLKGATPGTDFPDEGPHPDTEVGKQYYQLIRNNDFVRRPAAVPRIAVPTPFDAAAVLTGIQKHLNQDLTTMKLVDPVFASQIDGLLQTAVQAANQGNIQGLRSNIQDIRRFLKREHNDVDKEDKDEQWDDEDNGKPKPKLIDKLAAKVLDFDLKYVLKRVGEKS